MNAWLWFAAAWLAAGTAVALVAGRWLRARRRADEQQLPDASGVRVLELMLDEQSARLAPDEQLRPLFEDPTRIRLLPVVDEPAAAARAPYDHERGARLLDEIDRVLADVTAATPVEASAPRLSAVNGRAVPEARVLCGTDDRCARHDPLTCRYWGACCPTCPSVP